MKIEKPPTNEEKEECLNITECPNCGYKFLPPSKHIFRNTMYLILAIWAILILIEWIFGYEDITLWQILKNQSGVIKSLRFK